jgi:hypothetical protein
MHHRANREWRPLLLAARIGLTHALPMSAHAGLRVDDEYASVAVGLRLGTISAHAALGLVRQAYTASLADAVPTEQHLSPRLERPVCRALGRINVLAVNETACLRRSDEKCPDGWTRVPWHVEMILKVHRHPIYTCNVINCWSRRRGCSRPEGTEMPVDVISDSVPFTV